MAGLMALRLVVLKVAQSDYWRVGYSVCLWAVELADLKDGKLAVHSVDPMADLWVFLLADQSENLWVEMKVLLMVDLKAEM